MSEDEDMPLVCRVIFDLFVALIVSQATAHSSAVPPPRTLKRKKPVYAESSSDSEDDTPLASSPAKLATSAAVPMPGALQATTVPASSTNGKGKTKTKAEPSDDEYAGDDAPQRKRAAANKKPAKKKVKQDAPAASGSDDDEPIAAKKPSAPRKRKAKVESDSDDEKPIAKKLAAKKPRASKVKAEAASGDELPKAKKASGKVKKEEEDATGSPVKGKGRKKKEDEEEEVFRWWDADANGDGSVKWETLEHNGVIFPPPYEPLPSHVKMRYDSKLLCSFFGLELIQISPRQATRSSSVFRRSSGLLCSTYRERSCSECQIQRELLRGLEDCAEEEPPGASSRIASS
jgi:DNA topoisomerase-1